MNVNAFEAGNCHQSRVTANIVHALEMERPHVSVNGHIVVCDDEPDIRDTFAEYLEKYNFKVSHANGGTELRRIVEDHVVDAVILDIGMPGEDGLTLARMLREKGDIAIIMVTASGETIDRVVGLEVGADDYLPKPVDLRELLARIKAVLRRKKSAVVETDNSAATGLVQFGTYTLNIEAAKMTSEDGTDVPLTSMEFNLLKVFARNKGRVLNRDQILEQAHDRSWDPFDRSIDIRISRLRRKIESHPNKPVVIKTVRGIGYLFDPDKA